PGVAASAPDRLASVGRTLRRTAEIRRKRCNLPAMFWGVVRFVALSLLVFLPSVTGCSCSDDEMHEETPGVVDQCTPPARAKAPLQAQSPPPSVARSAAA